jgi:hypothetical protein
VLRIETDESLTLTRMLTNVSYANDLFEVEVAPAERFRGDHIQLRAGGEPLQAVSSRYVSDKYERLRDLGQRIPSSSYPLDNGRLIRWDLQQYRNGDVKLALTIRAGGQPVEVTWRNCRFHSAIENLPPTGEPLRPDVLLTSLRPLRVASMRPGHEPTINCIATSGGRRPPITFLGQVFANGWGMRTNSRLTFDIQPSYKRFVAVAGCCTKKAGPFRVLLDGKEAWASEKREETQPAVQVDVPIPPGTRRLTLELDRFGGTPAAGAWANAGFTTE